jgi:hypothetical protein
MNSIKRSNSIVDVLKKPEAPHSHGKPDNKIDLRDGFLSKDLDPKMLVGTLKLR